jgi:histidinol-phosphate aminotransferase
LAGVRIGYGFAHHTLIENLMKVKEPFEPSFVAQAAGLGALEDMEFLLKSIETNKTGMAYLKKELNQLGVMQIPSATNFITTVWESEEKANNLVQELLENGIIVRFLKGFGWPNCIRISIGLPEENQQFIACIKEIL